MSLIMGIDLVLDSNQYLDWRDPVWVKYERLGLISYVASYPGRAPAHVMISSDCPDVVESLKAKRDAP